MKKKDYYYEGKIVYVKLSTIAELFQVTERAVFKWDLPQTDKKAGRAKLYNLKEVIAYQHTNFKKSKNRIVDEDTGVYPSYTSIEDVDLSTVSAEEADRLKKIADVRLAEIRIAKELEELIDANDTDIAMAELAIMLKSTLITREKVLPILLEDKGKDEIKSILREYDDKLLSDLDEKFKKHFDCDETLYNVIDVVTSSDLSTKEIIEKIS